MSSITVELLDYMGDDVAVVNAAVSLSPRNPNGSTSARMEP